MAELSERLLAILACPVCKVHVERDPDGFLRCPACGRRYPVRDGIPVMLVEEGDAHRAT